MSRLSLENYNVMLETCQLSGIKTFREYHDLKCGVYGMCDISAQEAEELRTTRDAATAAREAYVGAHAVTKKLKAALQALQAEADQSRVRCELKVSANGRHVAVRLRVPPPPKKNKAPPSPPPPQSGEQWVDVRLVVEDEDEEAAAAVGVELEVGLMHATGAAALRRAGMVHARAVAHSAALRRTLVRTTCMRALHAQCIPRPSRPQLTHTPPLARGPSECAQNILLLGTSLLRRNRTAL